MSFAGMRGSRDSGFRAGDDVLQGEEDGEEDRRSGEGTGNVRLKIKM